MVAAKRAGAAAVSGSAKGRQQQPTMQTKSSEKPARRAQLHHQLQKTKLCSYHLKGACHYGQDCAFAHTCTELQVTPDLRKTRLCKAFLEGNCTDPECTFAHGEAELVSTDLYHKRSLCKWNEKGKCRNGDKCRFAHGLTELRGEGVDPEQQPAALPNLIPALGHPASAKQASQAARSAAPSEPEPMKVRSNLVEPGGALGGASAGLGGASMVSLGLPSPATFPPSLGASLAAPAPWQLAHHPLAQGIYEEVALQAEIAKLKENISVIAHQWSSIQSRMANSDDAMGALGTSPAALAAAVEQAQAYAAAPLMDAPYTIAAPPGFETKPYAQEADVDLFNAMSAMNMNWMYGEHAAVGA